MHYPSFSYAIHNLGKALAHAPLVHTERWQAFDIARRPEAKMRELIHQNFSVDLSPDADLTQLRTDIRPNLPWADDHFEQERVSGEPINPGETWKHWPWAHSAEKSLDGFGKFNHTYAERYWPRYARYGTPEDPGHVGILYRYGDLNDLITHMAAEPLTRQAYLPIFFPEDTGVANPGRKPCTLGYHWLMRDGKLHTTYYIRSCDYVRHFRDDIYLTVRLTLWLLQRLQGQSKTWCEVIPGRFRMDIGSLHCFVNDAL